MTNIVPLNNFLANLKQEMGAHHILKECCLHLNNLLNFKALAFFLIDESDHSFHLSYVEPTTKSQKIQAEYEYLVDQGIFAWALSQTKPIIEKTRDKQCSIIMQSLSTRSRIRGMFFGITNQHDILSQSDALDMLSAMLLTTSNILENSTLYNYINEQNKRLEETIAQRTFELEKARAAAEAENDAKSQFLASISHEIRTPLTAIVGYADLLNYKQLSVHEQERALQDISQAAKHLSNIINDILDISKIEANKLEIELIPTALFHLINAIVAIAQGQAKEKGLAFNLNYQYPLPKTITTDPTRLKQILLNLSNNAVKFTDTGEICIDVSYKHEQQQMIFSVTDTGMGINEEQQSNLFQKFVQADVSITRSYGGSGLGLAISKQLAEKLGGTITLESTPGKGSCFTAIIDTGEIDDSTLIFNFDQIPEQERKSNPWAVSEKLYGHILLAEDNINNQQLISLFLTKAGILVDIVDNGTEAVEKALTNDYDIILMDMQMPGMGGIEATELLRDTGYSDPILALTANATTEIKQQCQDSGFDDFLSKPIEVEKFFKVLSKYLKASPSINTPPSINGPEFKNILKQFTEDLPNTLHLMTQAFEQQDWETLKSHAHQLKGVAGGFGYIELGKTAAIIQDEIELKKINRIPQLLKKLQQDSEKINLLQKLQHDSKNINL